MKIHCKVFLDNSILKSTTFIKKQWGCAYTANIVLLQTYFYFFQHQVLALCICAANAASLSAYKPYKAPQQVAQAVAQVIQAPVVVAEAPVVAARTVVPVAKNVYTDEAHAAIVRLDSEVAADGYNYALVNSNTFISLFVLI